MPSSVAILSDVGHGTLGVRYRLRPFRDLLSETVGQRHLWVELRPKKLLTSWSAPGGPPIYTKAVAETFDGVVLDVVGVRTPTESLTRVESAALVVAGKYCYDGTTITLNLTGGADPGATSVVALLGVHVGSHGVYQPVFCSDRMTNGSFEAWTGTTPDGWTKTVGGTCTIDKTTTEPLAGSYAARATLTAGSGWGILHQNFTTLLAGGVYRFSGAYRATAGQAVKLIVWDTSSFSVAADGQTIIATDLIFEDADGLGEWRRFTFDFACPSWATVRIHLEVYNPTSTAGTVDLDDTKLACISRFAYHEPLLSVDGLPTVEAARADSFWGEMSSSLGSISLINRAGRLEPLLAAYDWLGAEAIVRVGGRYQLGGDEVLIDDCPIIASGRLGAPAVADNAVAFDMMDDRTILQRTLPTRTYNNNGGTDAYTQPDRGRARPLLWGFKTGIRPVQYDIHYTGGGPVPLGRYEVVDCTDWPSGVGTLLTVYWYLNEDAARARSTINRAFDQHVGLWVTEFATSGRFDVLGDLTPVVITQENNALHFSTGAGTLTATIAEGVYPRMAATGSSGINGLLTTAMRAVDGADVQCTFAVATQKMTLSKGAGTLSLLCATGSDVQTALWDVLGFAAQADKTGSLSYLADSIRIGQAYDQVIRCDAYGFLDDGSGTYTGSASSVIDKAPDIARFILQVILKVPASAIDVASFVAARAVADRPCSLYIGSSRSVSDVFSELETSGDMDLVLNGGVWSCLTRDTSVPAGTPDLVDADFLSFESRYNPEDLYGTVSLSYNESPDNPEPVRGGRQFAPPGSFTDMGEVTDPTVALRHGRPDQRTFKTCLRDKADATTSPARLQEIATQASTKRRRFAFTTKGKALLVPVGGKIRLTRTRGLDTSGALSGVLVRVLSKRDDWARWVSDVEAIEVV
jgi:hypothetical protein